MAVKLYEYAVILQPKRSKDGDVKEEAELIVKPSYVLANDEAQAGMLAARAIPDAFIDRLDRLTVVVRPF